MLSKAPNVVFWDAHTSCVKEIAEDEASAYAHGGSGNQVITAGRYGLRTAGYDNIEGLSRMDLNDIAVVGDIVEFDGINLVGRPLAGDLLPRIRLRWEVQPPGGGAAAQDTSEELFCAPVCQPSGYRL